MENHNNLSNAFLAGDTDEITELEEKSLAPKASLKVSLDPSGDEDTLRKSPCVSYTDEKFSKQESYITSSLQFRKRWRKAVLALQIFAIAGSLTVAVLSFKVSKDVDSAALFAFALDTILAILGNLVVIWRFRDVNNGTLQGSKRETFACIVYGSLFIAAGIGSSALAIRKLAGNDKAQHSMLLILIFAVACLFYAILALISYHIAKKLQSAVMLACCIDMGLDCSSVFVLVVSEVIYYHTQPNLWYLDNVGAIFVGCLAVIVGSKILADTLQCKRLTRVFSDSEENLTELLQDHSAGMSSNHHKHS